MVVQSVAITSKAGKTIFARQFVPMSRLHIEGLIAAFPKLIGSEAQHTFVETENVRYVYQPLENLYLILITNKQSNIMEDLETLRLLVKLIPEYCKGSDETSIQTNIYELLFAFDEVISLGYRENVTLEQIKTYTEMDSHEEKLQKIIMESKMKEAQEAASRKAAEIKQKKLDKKDEPGNKKITGHGSSNNIPRDIDTPYRPPVNEIPSKVTKGPGMQLGKKKDTSFLENLKHEEKFSVLPTSVSASKDPVMVSKVREAASVRLQIEEQIVVSLDKDGGLNKMEVKGGMKFIIVDPDQAFLAVKCVLDNKIESYMKGKGVFKYRTHPSLDAKAWASDSLLVQKDRSKPFAVGSESAVSVLQWKFAIQDAECLPLVVNFWPESENGRCHVSIQYTMNENFLEKGDSFVLNSVVFSIPCPSRDAPEVTQCDGDYSFNKKESVLLWKVDEIAPGSTGTFDYYIPEMDQEKLFPVEVRFRSLNTFCGLEVSAVNHSENETDIPYTVESTCGVEKYIIE